MDSAPVKNTIASCIEWAIRQPIDAIDARFLLCAALQQSHSYLYTWPDKALTPAQLTQFCQWVQNRKSGVPVAYLTGKKAFWTFELLVSEHTLIPRSDTETLVEVALELPLSDGNTRVLDLGTGTGAIALAIAAEKPKWNITAVDKVQKAVELAKKNAANLNLKRVTMVQSDWFSALSNQTFDLIVSNPPYVENNSEYLQQGDVRFEPASALTAGDDGLDDIRMIIEHAKAHLNPDGYIAFEHGHEQHCDVANLLLNAGFIDIQVREDLNQLQRVTFAQLPMPGSPMSID